MKTYKQYKASLYRYLKLKALDYYGRNCFRSIDELPIWWWKKAQEEGNNNYLIREKTIHIKKKKPDSALKKYALAVIWREIMDEFVSKFGFSEQYLELIRKEKELAMYLRDKIVNDDKSLNSYIRACEREIEELNNEMTGGDFFEVKAWIEKEMGFILNPMIVTVTEWHSYIKIIKSKSKKRVAVSE